MKLRTYFLNLRSRAAIEKKTAYGLLSDFDSIKNLVPSGKLVTSKVKVFNEKVLASHSLDDLLESATFTDITEIKEDTLLSFLRHQDQTSLSIEADNGISLHLKTTSTKRSILTIHFTENHYEQGVLSLKHFEAIVKDICSTIPIDYARIFVEIDNKMQSRPSSPIFSVPTVGSFPRRIYWITYFSNELVNYIGRKRFTKLNSCQAVTDLQYGIMIVLQEEPFDFTNSTHLKRQEKAEKQLRLHKL